MFPGQPVGVTACLIEGAGDSFALPLSQWKDQFLSAQECEWIPSEQPNPARRRQWIMARIAGKSAVIELLRRQVDASSLPRPKEITIANDADGAPSIHLPGTAEAGVPLLAVSLAHSGHAAAAAAGTGPVGIDLELLSRVPKFGWDQIATAAEMGLCRDVNGTDVPATPILQLWTAKESASKAARVGLASGLARWRLAAIQPNGSWTIVDQNTGRHYAVRFAVAGEWLMAIAYGHEPSSTTSP
jgi:phosphopantetheinyl transferase